MSSKSYPTLAPSTHRTSSERSDRQKSKSPAPVVTAPADNVVRSSPNDDQRSPKSSRSAPAPPKIIVKKEPPTSPILQSSRPRPRKLDLSTNIPPSSSPDARPSAGPRTAGGSLAMHDVGLACLSPGFQTHDPTMKEQLARSMSVREQQRSIIEQRLLKTAKGDGPDGVKPSESANPFGAPRAPTGGKKRPPAGLSIVPPSAQQFANERVIQSAPLHQTFTGRHDPPPMTRQVINQQPNLAQTSHIHHIPAIQTNNKLPPLSDVFSSDTLAPNNKQTYYPPGSASESSHSNSRPPFPSPGLPPSGGQSTSFRSREYRSAEEAVQEMTGGREELLPRLVHYGGHQPPTPPSPLHIQGLTPQKYLPHTSHGNASGAGRRRTRIEYEGDSSPPLRDGRENRPQGPFGYGRDSPETQRRKKEEFLGLCARAWDLFHN